MADLTFEDLFPSRFLKAGDFRGRDFTLTIEKTVEEDVPKHAAKKKGDKMRPVSFVGRKKQLCLNKTNGLLIMAIVNEIMRSKIPDAIERGVYSAKAKNWNGVQVTLGPAIVPSPQGDKEGCLGIRVKGSPQLSRALKVMTPKEGLRALTPTGESTAAAPTSTLDEDAPAGDSCPSCGSIEGGCDVCQKKAS